MDYVAVANRMQRRNNLRIEDSTVPFASGCAVRGGDATGLDGRDSECSIRWVLQLPVSVQVLVQVQLHGEG